MYVCKKKSNILYILILINRNILSVQHIEIFENILSLYLYFPSKKFSFLEKI